MEEEEEGGGRRENGWGEKSRLHLHFGGGATRGEGRRCNLSPGQAIVPPFPPTSGAAEYRGGGGGNQPQIHTPLSASPLFPLATDGRFGENNQRSKK